MLYLCSILKSPLIRRSHHWHEQLFWWAYTYRIANFPLGGPNIRSLVGWTSTDRQNRRLGPRNGNLGVGWIRSQVSHRVGTQHLDELLDTVFVAHSVPMLNQNVKGFL